MPKPSALPKPSVILVRPKEEGNIGSVARAMANMGLERLILVEPAPSLAGVARGFGVGGWHILEAVERRADLNAAVAPFARVIGTTSTRARRLRGCPVLSPRALVGSLNADPPNTAAALLFGPEDSGLSRTDLSLCDTLVNIPSDQAHPTLNLAQAVLIISYELFLDQQRETSQEVKLRTAKEKLATAADLDRLLHHIARLLTASGYPENPGTRAILNELRRLSARGSPSLKEVRTIRKICLRLIAALTKPESICD